MHFISFSNVQRTSECGDEEWVENNNETNAEKCKGNTNERQKKNYFFFSKTTDSYLGHSHALCMHTLFSSCYFSLFNSSNYMKCDIDLTAGTSVSVCLTNFYSYMRRLCVRFFEIYFHATCTAWRCVFKCAWTASSTFITIHVCVGSVWFFCIILFTGFVGGLTEKWCVHVRGVREKKKTGWK